MAQRIKHPTSAGVIILQFVGSSPTSGSVLTAQSLEPASDSLSPSLSAPPPLMLCLSKINIKKIKKNGSGLVVQSVKVPTLAQVMILWLVSSSPALGSALISQSLEPSLDSVSPSLSAPLLFALSLSQR